MTTSMALFWTSISGSRSSAATRSTSIGPSMRCSAESAAPRISLFGSFSSPCSAVCTSGVLKRARMLMMCTRAIGSLPCRRPMSSRRRLVGDLADDAKQRRLLVRLLRVGGVQQLAHAEARLLRGNHLQHRRLGDAGGGERLEQQVGRVVAAVGERPGDAGDDARAALDQTAHELREGLLADERGEHLDERHGRVLVGFRQGAEDRLDGTRPDVLQPCDRLLPGRACRIGRGPDLGDQPVGTQVREKAHSAFPSGAASCTRSPSPPSVGARKARARRGSIRWRRRCRSGPVKA